MDSRSVTAPAAIRWDVWLNAGELASLSRGIFMSERQVVFWVDKVANCPKASLGRGELCHTIRRYVSGQTPQVRGRTPTISRSGSERRKVPVLRYPVPTPCSISIEELRLAVPRTEAPLDF